MDPQTNSHQEVQQPSPKETDSQTPSETLYIRNIEEKIRLTSMPLI